MSSRLHFFIFNRAAGFDSGDVTEGRQAGLMSSFKEDAGLEMQSSSSFLCERWNRDRTVLAYRLAYATLVLWF